MAHIEAISFDNLTVGGATDYDLRLEAPLAPSEMSIDASFSERTSYFPGYDSATFETRTIAFQVRRPQNAAADLDDWRENVKRYFSPFIVAARTLNATHPNGAIGLTTSVLISRLVQTAPGLFEGEFVIVSPGGMWLSAGTTTDTDGVLTNSGNANMLPVITVTPSGAPAAAAIKRKRFTITDNYGYGLDKYPILLTFDSTLVGATTAADFRVIYNGRDIPFNVTGMNTASTRIWCRVNVPASGSIFIDVYFGSAINNTITANAYNAGGMDLANSSNTSWVWNGYEPSSYPDAVGVWRLSKLGRNISGQGYEITSEAPTTLTFSVGLSGDMKNDADALVLTLGVPAGTTNALSGYTATLTIGTTSVNAVLAKRTKDQAGWTTVTSRSLTTGNLTAPADVDGAIQLAFYLESTNNTGSGTLAISGTALTLALDSGETPTVSAAATVDAWDVDITLTNTTTGDTVVIDLLIDNTTIEIDCLNREVSTGSGPYYGSVQPSNPGEWLPCKPGSNTITFPDGMTINITWQTRYNL